MTQTAMYHIPLTPSNWQQHVRLAELEIEEIDLRKKLSGINISVFGDLKLSNG